MALYQSVNQGYSRPGSKFKWKTAAPGQQAANPMFWSSTDPMDNPANLAESQAPDIPMPGPSPTMPANPGMAAVSGPQKTGGQSITPGSTPPVATTNAAFANPEQQQAMLSDVRGYSAPRELGGSAQFNPSPQMAGLARLQDIIRQLTGRKAIHELRARPRKSGRDLLGMLNPGLRR